MSGERATADVCACGHRQVHHSLRVRNVANCALCICGAYRGPDYYARLNEEMDGDLRQEGGDQ